MATLARLQARSKFVAQQYYFRNSVVDIFRKKEYDAAVKIQSWFRGCQVRAHIRNLHRVATIIQKWWRSYSGRQEYQLIVKFASCAMKMNLYNAMAVRIQRRWRGYRIRKYCFNYFYLKEYLKAVSETNDAIREALEEFAEMKEREEKKADLEREEKKRDYQARKTHYLLSTKQIPGIYNSPFRKDPDPWELRLQKAKPLTYQRSKVKQKRCISLSSWLACTSARSFPRSEILPPIDRKQCQGPFRDITEVLEQRYKPLEPTLWVAEPISELKVAREEFRRQEWMRDVNDNMFLPFSSYHKNKKYTPLMHSSSKYGPNSYGSQHFRDENPKKWICDKDFQTVLPSFDLFSKYGKLYSKAGQII
ncbi:spermatogenesis-associated protein 17 isoform X1 [Zalophus californianus]|uniref:Spermatogenesis-associated protein 17 isoform X1 n=2 Tax=Zalophus californianus TaxID=9704 RepID=A0A6J2EP28_ZALCA|nr:spermatogenesis-associated protein 17 isoform X1 [Zalophus californianus]XP_027470017.1 spermatogenesis-associated protein 17 isoform X1 [Zalophus californianus]XP_027470018.1 spermatogenesis-associated protein 17 isoform X1 [Zalophus californianus]XP_027470019.1 spermatogenesis-associated protein 17 isoform X1 [Zalophus californianus]XP_027470020.1 spermatogenesis-associated protein 17 isoform X1 [Zalophus californianus]